MFAKSIGVCCFSPSWSILPCILLSSIASCLGCPNTEQKVGINPIVVVVIIFYYMSASASGQFVHSPLLSSPLCSSAMQEAKVGPGCWPWVSAGGQESPRLSPPQGSPSSPVCVLRSLMQKPVFERGRQEQAKAAGGPGQGALAPCGVAGACQREGAGEAGFHRHGPCFSAG